MACIFFKNSQGYKIKQIDIPSLNTFPYRIFTHEKFSPIIFVTLQIGTIEDIIYVLLKVVLNTSYKVGLLQNSLCGKRSDQQGCVG